MHFKTTYLKQKEQMA